MFVRKVALYCKTHASTLTHSVLSVSFTLMQAISSHLVYPGACLFAASESGNRYGPLTQLASGTSGTVRPHSTIVLKFILA